MQPKSRPDYRCTRVRWVGLTSAPGIQRSSVPNEWRERHVSETEDCCDSGRRPDGHVRSRPARGGRRARGNETCQVLAGRLARHRRWAPVRGLLLPDRGEGLPARRCRRLGQHLASRRECHLLPPRCTGKALVLAATPSRAGHSRSGARVTGPDHRPRQSPPKGSDGGLRDCRPRRPDRRHGDIQSPARVHHHDGPTADRAPRRGRVGSSLYLRPGILWIRLLRLPGA